MSEEAWIERDKLKRELTSVVDPEEVQTILDQLRRTESSEAMDVD